MENEASTSALDTDDSSSDNNNQRPAYKKIKYSQKFKKQWQNEEEFKNWITPDVKKGETYAYCKVCHKSINIKSTGRIALIRHGNSDIHKKLLKSVKGQKLLTSFGTNRNLENMRKQSEMHIAAFITEHNLSYNLMGHFVRLLPKICPDSEVAKLIKCGRMKCSSLVKNVIGKIQLEQVCNQLKTTKFSLIIDESTDRGCTKHLCLIARYFQNERVMDTFLTLLPLQGATAEDLYKHIVAFFNSHNVPYKENLIGFASDGANVMVGKSNSVVTRLQSDVPNLFILRCVCHSFSLCASGACKKLPRRVEDLVRNTYNFFSNSPKRIESLKEFQKFTNTPIHKILHPVQTRWLSLESAINRIIEQYNSLILYFTDAVLSEGVLAAENILHDLQDQLTKPFLLFLQFILPIFTNMNKEMQSENPKIQKLHFTVSANYKTLLEYFIKRDVIQRQKLHDINYKDPNNYLPIEQIYLGAKISMIIDSLSNDSKLTLRVRCLDFFIEAADQLNKRFDFKNEILANMNIICPSKLTANGANTMSSIVSLAKYFPNLIAFDQLQQLDNEWRLLQNCEIVADASMTSLNVDAFWNKVSKMQYGDSSLMFPLVSSFVLNILCLPHSSANVERIFSQVNLMKTDSRNRLCTASIVGHLHTKHFLKNRNDTCFSVNFSRELLALHNSNMYKKNQELTDSGEDDSD